MIIDDYLELQQKYEKQYGPQTVVLMEVGSFYELYGVNNTDHNIGKVEEIARLLDIQMTRKNKKILENSFKNPLLAGFPSFCLQKYLERLVQHDFTVVVAEQDRPGSGANRNVTGIYSPGVYLESSPMDNRFLMICYFENHDTYKKDVAIGVTLFDITTGESRLYEFYPRGEDNLYSLDQLYRLIQNYQPPEVVCTGEFPQIYLEGESRDVSSFEQQLSICGRKKHYLWESKKYDNIDYQQSILGKYFPNHGLLSVLEFLDLERRPYSLKSFLTGLDFVYQHLPNVLQYLSKPKIIDEENRLILSRDSAIQLHLITDSHSTDISKKKSCLLEIINYTRTPMGKRMLRDRLLSPVTDKKMLEERYDEIDSVKGLQETLVKHLTGIIDMERLHRRALLRKLAPTQFYNLDQCFSQILRLVDVMYTSKKPLFYQELTNYMNIYKEVLCLDKCMLWNLDQIDQNPFNHGVHETLDNYQLEIEKKISYFENVAHILSKAIEPSQPNPNGVKIEYNERDGYHFSVTQKRLAILKKHWPSKKKDIPPLKNMNFRNAQSQSNRVVKIFSPEIKNAHETRVKYQSLIQTQARQLYLDTIEKWHQSHDALITQVIDWVSKIDVAVSNALLASKYGYVRPTIVDNPESSVTFEGLRHPIIERIQEDVSYVPNDISLGKEGQYGVLLYGVNACGKSSLMRSIGCSVILAQSGCFVPASSMILSPYKHLFTRISNNDNLFKGQSTFAVEMSELRSILQRSNEHSLVLGDELCSGTESTSALAIVGAGVEWLHKKKSSFMFATHLHSLSSLETVKILENVKHYHLKVHCDPLTNKLVYDRRLTPGSGSSLYGLEVCRAMDMPDSFITRANSIRQDVTGELNSIYSTHQSHYNHNVFIDCCQVCQKKGSEVHHIKFQCTADHNELIDGRLPKDHKSNLVVLCHECHQSVHHKDLVIHGYIHTSQGIELKYDYDQSVATTNHQVTNPRKITAEIEEAVINYCQQAHMTQRRTTEKIKEDFGVAISISSVSKIWKSFNQHLKNKSYQEVSY